MTVKELINELKQYAEDAEIYVATECHGCFEPAARAYADEPGVVVIDSGLPAQS